MSLIKWSHAKRDWIAYSVCKICAKETHPKDFCETHLVCLFCGSQAGSCVQYVCPPE